MCRLEDARLVLGAGQITESPFFWRWPFVEGSHKRQLPVVDLVRSKFVCPLDVNRLCSVNIKSRSTQYVSWQWLKTNIFDAREYTIRVVHAYYWPFSTMTKSSKVLMLVWLGRIMRQN